MKYIVEMKPDQTIQEDTYLVREKKTAVTKSGKEYLNIILQDRTGQLECRIWEPDSPHIQKFEAMDYIAVTGKTSMFNGKLQATITAASVMDPGKLNKEDYYPVSKNNRKAMYGELREFMNSVENPYLKKLLQAFFEDKELVKKFVNHSAAKSVHHGFIGGLLEHTLGVTRICDFIAKSYPAVDRDLLITVSVLHDIGKLEELSEFPVNDYTDCGQLLGHIMIGVEMIHDRASRIEGFPAELEMMVKHCIIAHHGEYEYGSPKKPSTIEAMALNLADNMDAKMEMLTEVLAASPEDETSLGWNRFIDSYFFRSKLK